MTKTEAKIAAAQAEARAPYAQAISVLTAALSEAATHLDQAAETLARHGMHSKASMYRGDAEAARAAARRVGGTA